MAKIKFFDKATRSKVLLTARWRHLSGNKLPYLAVDIHQVLVNGESVDSWQEKKDAVKNINSELYQLVNLHLCDIDGKGMHELANDKRHLSLVKQQMTSPIGYTSEQKQSDLKSMLTSLDNHKVFKLLKAQEVTYFKEYYKNNSDRFRYPNSERAINHWKDQFKLNGTLLLDGRNFLKEIKDFFTLAEKYSNLYHSYKTLPSNKDVWTCERFSKTYDIDLPKVYEMICTDNLALLETMIEEKQKEVKIFIDMVTEKYKIEVVKG